MASGENETTDFEDLHRRLEEAEETLRAIRSGEVDALVVAGAEGERVYTLQGADHAYRALIESMQQGAVSLGFDGTVLYCNRRFAEMVARPQEKVIGAAMAGFIHAPDQTLFEVLLRRGGALGSQGELRLDAVEGPPTPAYLALSPLALGESSGICLVVSDLTEQKKHQDLLEVNRRKDEFLAMLAHELRNPLAPIRNALYLMKRGEVDESSAAEVRTMMERQVEHLSRLIDDLMDVSRISTGKVDLRLDEVDLASVVARSIDVCRPLIEQRGHRFTVDLPAVPIRLRADPTRLEQIVDNLLTNAAKYSDPGGRIDLSAGIEGNSAILRLRDTGIGIDPGKLPHIFDLFVQAERRLDRSQGGLGIGLSLVRSLVGMHGGTVMASSEGLGKGSEFVVRLPALPVPVMPKAPKAPAPRPRRPNCPQCLAPHPGRRRQRGLREVDGPAPEADVGTGGRGCPQRRGGAREGGDVPPQPSPARHRPAWPERLRRGRSAPRPARGRGREARGHDRLGQRGRPPPLSGVGLRPPPGQARGPRRAPPPDRRRRIGRIPQGSAHRRPMS